MSPSPYLIPSILNTGLLQKQLNRFIQWAWDASGGGSVLTNSVTAAASDIQTANSTPFVLLAAPGAGKIIYPLYLAAKYNYGTIPFSANDSNDQVNVGPVRAFFGDLVASIGLDLTTDGRFFGDGTGVLISTSPIAIENQPAYWQPASDWNNGLVSSIAVSSGGGGALYAPGDTGNIEPSDAAIYTVDTVDIGGAVLTLHISSNGIQVPGTGLSTTPLTGVGSGLTVDLSVIPGDGTIDFTLYYLLGEA